MRHKFADLGIVALSLFGLTSGSFAQTPSAPRTLDDTVRREAVESAAEILRNRYIFPDVGAQAAQAIETALAEGRYDSFAQHQPFAVRMTADLQAVANDKHLRVMAPGAPPAPADTPAAAPAAVPPPVRPRDQGGITRADILADNVGYIEVVGFPSPFAFEAPTGRAMQALKDTRALIIDIRRNGGGSPESVTHLVSYFLDGGEPVHINTFINRTPDTETFTTREFWSEATPFSYTYKPVYVLTSDFTFSGGEEFAYDMQVLGLAKLIGATTGGGANPGGVMPIADGLAMFVPGGRAENPITGTNWEGVGVVPDFDVPTEDALAVALERLGVSPSVTDIDAASQSRVFEPAPLRSEQQPGGAAAVRRMSDELARGDPDYEMLSPQLAEVTRAQLAALTELVSPLGEIESVTFVEVAPNGLDVYDVRYADGAMRWMIGLDEDGRTAMAGVQPLAGQP